MNKKTFRIACAVVCGALIITGLVLQFTHRNGTYPTSAIALSMVGLLLSIEYQGEKWRTLIRILQALAVLIILATPVGWFIPTLVNPGGHNIYYMILNIGAIICNAPLAFIGFQRKNLSE